MSNYENKTDLEVNQRLADLLKIPTKVEHGSLFINNGWEDGACVYTYVDYCNRWQDIGGLIDEHQLSLGYNSEGYPYCVKHHGSVNDIVFSSSTKRAAAICLIKILEN